MGCQLEVDVAIMTGLNPLFEFTYGVIGPADLMLRGCRLPSAFFRSSSTILFRHRPANVRLRRAGEPQIAKLAPRSNTQGPPITRPSNRNTNAEDPPRSLPGHPPETFQRNHGISPILSGILTGPHTDNASSPAAEDASHNSEIIYNELPGEDLNLD